MVEQSQIQAELQKAVRARLIGKEGQARVCSRRAAGLATRAYLVRQGQVVRTTSAYDLLKLLTEDLSLPVSIAQAAAHLTLRVDEQFKMPLDMDLISDARKLCDYLSNA